jgi:hypothetical protein
LALAPVEMITVWASIVCPAPSVSLNGRCAKSTSVMSSVTIRVP